MTWPVKTDAILGSIEYNISLNIYSPTTIYNIIWVNKLGLWSSSPLQQLGLKAQQMVNMLGNSKRVKLDCKLECKLGFRVSTPLQQLDLKAQQMMGDSKRVKLDWVKLDCKLGLWASSPLQQPVLKAQQMVNMLGNSKRVKLDCKLGFRVSSPLQQLDLKAQQMMGNSRRVKLDC